ncbi:MAG: L-asparaginase [Subtercola sp.]|nr:L-asparaginase [Subtercola sp.]
MASSPADRARIVIFSGPRATIQNSAALRTSQSVRRARNLAGADDSLPEALRAQRLAAPVTAYVQAYSAHPLEQDARELYGPVDGWLHPETRAFTVDEVPGGTPVYEVVLDPADGPYPLPYTATQANGEPWNGSFDDAGHARQLFYPDASRIVEEIDHFGLDGYGGNNLLSGLADFDFVRAAPSGGYTKGQPEADRTDTPTAAGHRGEPGDLAAEVLGEDFFPYMPMRQEPALPTLASLTNIVADTLASGDYDGAIWLEGSPTTEETVYWLNLVIGTTKPLIGNCSQYGHGVFGNDGDHNLVQSATYIASKVWADARGHDRVGAVMIQNGQVFTAREVQKADARPGGYIAHGGHGGIVGNTVEQPVLSFLPVALHTHTSQLRLDTLPSSVPGLGGAQVQTLTESGHLRPEAMPKVTIARYVNYGQDDFSDSADSEVEILARIEKNLRDHPLSGMIAEGSAPYGGVYESMGAALLRGVFRGMPVVAVGRGGGGYAFGQSTMGGLLIRGSNLSAPKARILLMASLLKFGTLPLPADADAPTPVELDAIRAKVAEYQQIFDSH